MKSKIIRHTEPGANAEKVKRRFDVDKGGLPAAIRQITNEIPSALNTEVGEQILAESCVPFKFNQ